MAVLYLHIGMTKTGSTSIEATFHENRALLLKHGIDYLDFGQNHSKIMVVAAKGKAKGLKGDAIRIIGVEKKDDDYDPGLVRRELEARFEAPKAPVVVVSGQGLLGYSPKDVERMKDFCARFFDDIRIIVYVRDPTSWASSRAQENMKRGHSMKELVDSVRDTPEQSHIVPEYRSGIETYIRVFGREKVDIRVFDRRRFHNGDLIADFCEALGADPAVAAELPRGWNNRGASAEALLLIQAHYDIVEERARALAASGGTPIVDKVDPLRPGKKDRVGQYRVPSANFPFRQAVRDIRGSKFALPKPVLDEIWAHVMDEVRWLREVTGNPDLFADAYPPPETPPPAWSAETLADLAKVIESGLGEVMEVENRRRRLPVPVRMALRFWHKARRRVGL